MFHVNKLIFLLEYVIYKILYLNSLFSHGPQLLDDFVD